MDYSMKEMAERFGVTEHTLRYYTDQGLLPCRREGGGRRVVPADAAVSAGQQVKVKLLKVSKEKGRDGREHTRISLSLKQAQGKNGDSYTE